MRFVFKCMCTMFIISYIYILRYITTHDVYMYINRYAMHSMCIYIYIMILYIYIYCMYLNRYAIRYVCISICSELYTYAYKYV